MFSPGPEAPHPTPTRIRNAANARAPVPVSLPTDISAALNRSSAGQRTEAMFVLRREGWPGDRGRDPLPSVDPPAHV